MLRRNNYERSVTDGWASFDPVDHGVIETLYKKQIREGEEGLMLAVLDNAIECFQKYVLASANAKGDYSEKQKNGFWKEIAIGFSLLKISVKL